MNASSVSVFRLQFLDTAALGSVVSSAIPMQGNTVLVALNARNVGGTAALFSLSATLEGSVDGQFWESIGTVTVTTWTGGVSSPFTVEYAMVRVRVSLSASGGGAQGKAWFDVGLAFTSQ